MASIKKLKKESILNTPKTTVIPATNNQILSSFNLKNINYVILLSIVTIIFFVFYSCLSNQFTNWDDPQYVTENPLIKSLSYQNFKEIFSTSVMGNYHPLTILSYAIDYNFFALEPTGYHLHNLILHLVVCLLVYWFTYRLSNSKIVASVTSLLFGLHPMHSETVLWVSDRKDLLSAAYYFLACIFYLFYKQEHKKIKSYAFYLIVVFFFLCSLLSKPTAVVFPITLLLIDFFEKRKISLPTLLEKLPFFLIALIFGIKAIIEQSKIGAVKTGNTLYSIIERIELGFYSLFTYLWKSIIPFNLSCIYSYPEKSNNTLPSMYIIVPIIVILVVYTIWKYARTNTAIIFGTLFFFFNIALLLQFFQVGDALVAERYTYIPYYGIFLIEGFFVQNIIIWQIDKRLKIIVLLLFVLYIGILGYTSNNRCNIWNNSVSLWQDAINKQPESTIALNNLGAIYFDKFNETELKEDKKIYKDSCYTLLNESISIDSGCVSSYVTLGTIAANDKQFNIAKKYLYRVLFLNHTINMAAQAYLILSSIYLGSNNFDSARYCIYKANIENSSFAGVSLQYGKVYAALGKFDSAIVKYKIAISQNPQYYETYLWIGEAEFANQNVDIAITYFDKGISLSNNHPELFYDRSICFYQKGDKTKALQDVEKAISLGFNQVDPTFYNILKK